MLVNFLQSLPVLAGASTGDGIIALAAAIAVASGMMNAWGEAKIAIKAIDAMMRVPEQTNNIRNTMILGIALVETTAIYALLVAILIIFILG